jgi:PLP dependent protein
LTFDFLILTLINQATYQSLRKELDTRGVTLVAVSKFKPASDIQTLYDLGQRDFGENYVQELVEKAEALPKDIRWHFIGHLQSNKIKYIAPFVHLIHGVDSEKLLRAIDKQAEKAGRRIDVLLQVHIAQEETKFGLDAAELDALLSNVNAQPLLHTRLRGLMGMASFSEDAQLVAGEFGTLQQLWEKARVRVGEGWDTLSMGMSNDYGLAITKGSTLVRIGSLLFGARG